MKEVVLNEDVTRKYGKADKTYGKKGERVRVVSIHGDVLIVEGKERFSVRKEFVKEVK